MLLEYICYRCDYNDLQIMSQYIIYDLEYGVINSFSNERYEVFFYNNDSGSIGYEITLKRDSLFNVKQLKTIKYNGLVE